MKSLTILIITLILSVSAKADTDSISKPKFHFQLGQTNMNFINGYGFNASDNNSIFFCFLSKLNYSIDYEINKKVHICPR